MRHTSRFRSRTWNPSGQERPATPIATGFPAARPRSRLHCSPLSFRGISLPWLGGTVRLLCKFFGHEGNWGKKLFTYSNHENIALRVAPGATVPEECSFFAAKREPKRMTGENECPAPALSVI